MDVVDYIDDLEMVLATPMRAAPMGSTARMLQDNSKQGEPFNGRQDRSAQSPRSWCYTVELVRRLKDTLIEGDRTFLASLDPQEAARDLVDDRFVKTARAANGGLAAFGFPESFTRTESFAP